jgi:hypothetical protein
MDDVHDSGVFGWIKQGDVPFMHSQSGKPPIIGSLSKDLAGISIPLNSDNWSVAENKVCKESTSVTCKKVHCPDFIHIITFVFFLFFN